MNEVTRLIAAVIGVFAVSMVVVPSSKAPSSTSFDAAPSVPHQTVPATPAANPVPDAPKAPVQPPVVPSKIVTENLVPGRTPTPTEAPLTGVPVYAFKALLTGSPSSDTTKGSNDGGFWAWRGQRQPGVLVVLGGSSHDEALANYLVDWGLVVYRPRVKYCKPDTRSMPFCRAHHGHLVYLADERPSTPRAEYTVFLSAEEDYAASPGQKAVKGIVERINEAVARAQGSGAVVAVESHSTNTPGTTLETTDMFRAAKGMVTTYLSRFIETAEFLKLGDTLPSTTKAVQFVVTRDMIDTYPVEMYNTAFQYMLHHPDSRYNEFVGLFSVIFTSACFKTVVPYPQPSYAVATSPSSMSFHQNAAGYWTVNPDGKFSAKNILVVIGGASDDCSHMLVEAGFTVWKSRVSCGKGGRCRENWGYIKYLRDETPGKPKNNVVVFLHGHWESQRHQRESLLDLIINAADCAEKTNKFSSITKIVNFRAGRHAQGVISTFNSVFGEFRKIPASESDVSNHFCCAQFALSRSLIESNPPALYRKMDEFHEDARCHGIYYELIWHFFFKEPVSVDISDDTCEPPLRDFYMEPFRKSFGASVKVTTNRFGVWTEQATDPRKKNVLVVTGLDYRNWYLASPPTVDGVLSKRNFSDNHEMDARKTKFITDMHAAGYDLFVRRPLPGIHWGARGSIRGYLQYITDPNRPMRDTIVFLRGDEVVTPEFLTALEKSLSEVDSARSAGGEQFSFIQWSARYKVSDPPLRQLVGEHGWSNLNAARFCDTGKFPATQEGVAKILPKVEGSQFAIGSGVLKWGAIHPQCLTELMVVTDFDYTGKYTELLHFYWRMTLGKPPSLLNGDD
eukprot:TRINITY_DN58485_c0_g1_i1.p1 TRINITY_DN58485_c0_g1~~TRINITY_DN58485_c0_g1_i1.p1  ORF type:complete len:848 (+),score=298.43 TRINITY_DN58485_c0_g1_i1:87-2630(+)